MALFERKLKKENKDAAPKKEAKPRKSVKKTDASAPKAAAVLGIPDVIIRPRVTEKAANLTTANVYTFDVRVSATKHDVAKAITALYKVTPIRVNVVNVAGKRVSLRRKRGFGTTASSRKAYVYLKHGEEIQFS